MCNPIKNIFCVHFLLPQKLNQPVNILGGKSKGLLNLGLRHCSAGVEPLKPSPPMLVLVFNQVHLVVFNNVNVRHDDNN